MEYRDIHQPVESLMKTGLSIHKKNVKFLISSRMIIPKATTSFD